MFEWRLPGDSLLDIALDDLTLGRPAPYQAQLGARSEQDKPAGQLDDAVNGLRRAGAQEFISRVSRAWLRGPTIAQADLDEAWEIAERGPMPLHLADIHLHRTRLFGHLTAGACPWRSTEADLKQARRLIEKHGYWRRKEELEDAEAAAQARARSTS